ncbi:MAG: U32 family peptidase [Bacilli bacterium]|nr:U32 family peptidase [Bacilli bacterium]
MKLLIEKNTSNFDKLKIDGIILSLKDYSVQSTIYYDLDEIKDIINKYPKLEVFIKMNKNIFNDEIDKLKEMLIELNKINIKGIFFYDLAILNIKQELNLDVDLVWDQSHMVNNYRTCDYYYNEGVKYALLGKEITLEEIKEIVEKSKITSMVEVVSTPAIAYSKRKLLTNYYKSINKDKKDTLEILEKVSNKYYIVKESNNGTSFYTKDIMNGTSIIKDLYSVNTPYIIMREEGVPDFDELVNDTYTYIENECKDNDYIEKYKKLGDNTNFFFKETMYKVK